MVEYIDRKWVMSDLEYLISHTAPNSSEHYAYNLVKRIVKSIPTTDVVEVKHGKWVRTDAYPHRIYCSVCYKTYVTNEEIIQGRSWYPAYCTEAEWCPHCGARMDGSVNDE